MITIALVGAPEVGKKPLANWLWSHGLQYPAATRTALSQLAHQMGTEDTAMMTITSVLDKMNRFDYVFYIPAYSWNVVDDGFTELDEDRRFQIDTNIQNVLALGKLQFWTVPEAPTWDRGKYVLSVIE